MSSPVRDYYALLGVGRDATAEEIKRAYRKLARELHPDVNPDPASQDRFKDITAAYEVLSDPEKRRIVDLGGDPLSSGGGGGGTGGASGTRDGGASLESSAATRAAALGNRFSGAFSSSIMTERPRSFGTSARRCCTGTGSSEMCFTSIAGVLPALKGGSPVSIW